MYQSTSCGECTTPAFGDHRIGADDVERDEQVGIGVVLVARAVRAVAAGAVALEDRLALRGERPDRGRGATPARAPSSTKAWMSRNWSSTSARALHVVDADRRGERHGAAVIAARHAVVEERVLLVRAPPRRRIRREPRIVDRRCRSASCATSGVQRRVAPGERVAVVVHHQDHGEQLGRVHADGAHVRERSERAPARRRSSGAARARRRRGRARRAARRSAVRSSAPPPAPAVKSAVALPRPMTSCAVDHAAVTHEAVAVAPPRRRRAP